MYKWIYKEFSFINNIAGIFIVHFEIHSCTLGKVTKGTEGYDSVKYTYEHNKQVHTHNTYIHGYIGYVVYLLPTHSKRQVIQNNWKYNKKQDNTPTTTEILLYNSHDDILNTLHETLLHSMT